MLYLPFARSAGRVASCRPTGAAVHSSIFVYVGYAVGDRPYPRPAVLRALVQVTTGTLPYAPTREGDPRDRCSAAELLAGADLVDGCSYFLLGICAYPRLDARRVGSWSIGISA
jgi:hypothetical protein